MSNFIFISLKSNLNRIYRYIMYVYNFLYHITIYLIYHFNIIIFKVIIPYYCNGNTVLNLDITVNCCQLDIISYNIKSIYHTMVCINNYE